MIIWEISPTTFGTVSIANLQALLKLVEGKSVFLEEYARQMVYDEEIHVSEVNKMLRTQPK